MLRLGLECVTQANKTYVVIDTYPAGNIKVTKAKSEEKIDAIVASIMALDRFIRHEGEKQGSVYDERGLIVF